MTNLTSDKQRPEDQEKTRQQEFPKLRPPTRSETGTVRLGDCAITYKR